LIDPKEYLERLYTARALFKLLFAEAIMVIPPAAPDDTKRWELESIRSQRDLGNLLGVSPSTVAIDLTQLENYGWIEKKKRGTRRLLGARKGAQLLLRADSAAEAATGVPGLISREVLGVAQAVQDVRVEAPEFTCGPARKWRPD